MKKHWIILLILGCAILTGCGPGEKPAARESEGPRRLAVPTSGAYTGAYIDFGDNEDDVTLAKIEKFEQLCGKHQAIIASSSYWGEQNFPTANLELILRHGSVPLLFWSPWDKPYDQDLIEKNGPDRFNLNSILHGDWDAYIDAWGDSAKSVGEQFFVSFGNEMNGSWFPWSGCFYGAGSPAPGSTPAAPTPIPGYDFTADQDPVAPPAGPEVYKAAFRYVVDRVRARGATNVLWVFHANNYSAPIDLWNLAAAYYPGSDYVDWLALSIYGRQFGDQPNGYPDFVPLFEWPVREIQALDPTKPIMLAEWGVGEFPNDGNKAKWFSDAFEIMKKTPAVKAAIYWNERWQNADSSYSNLRINSSPPALQAYQKGVSDPFYLAHPVFESDVDGAKNQLVAKKPGQNP